MKLSLTTAQHYSNVGLLPSGGVDELVQKIGAQLGAVETVDKYGDRFEGVLVAKVVKCIKHPNADKLSVCLVDDGGVAQDVDRKDGLVEVVCGAPNIAEGLTVSWIPPGVTVPSTFGTDDPFVLEARELRGIVSNGMIASASELGISDDHSGILIINSNDVGEELTKPGTSFRKLYGLDDTIIDIENKMFTHRPDCFGILGLTREVAGIQGLSFESPEWYLSQPVFEDASELPLSVKNELPDLVPRFMAVTMSNVEIKPSPIWLQAILTRVGMKPINNIVDITNYLGYITAQPLHAYDYDKVKALSNGDPVLVVRKPKNGERVSLLNGKTIEPRDEAIMIASDKELLGVGGIMGGTTTEVDDSTKNIIVECANFDMYSIRRTSMQHGLFTDAATRFTKGQSALQNDRVIAEAMRMTSELSNAKQASNVIDNVDCDRITLAHDGWNDQEVAIDADFINHRLGTELSVNEIDTLLKHVEFGSDIDGEQLKVYSPFWRTDIDIKEDIVEEVGRLLGFDKLPSELPVRAVTPSILDPKLETKKRIRSNLAKYGANEVLTYSFVHGDLLAGAGQDVSQAFKLSNALSPALQYYRLSLTPSLLNHVHQNIKAGHDDFALFEIGKSHNKNLIDEENVPIEFDRIALTIASRNRKDAAYFHAKLYTEKILGDGFRLVEFDSKLYEKHEPIAQMTAPFDPDRSALVIAPKGYVVGVVGEYKMAVMKSFKLPRFSAGFELFLSAFAITNATEYVPLSRFPGTTGDITLEVDQNLPYQDLADRLDESLQKSIKADQYVDWRLSDIYTSETIGKKRRYTFHIVLTSYSHTLTDKVLTDYLAAAIDQIKESINVQQI